MDDGRCLPAEFACHLFGVILYTLEMIPHFGFLAQHHYHMDQPCERSVHHGLHDFATSTIGAALQISHTFVQFQKLHFFNAKELNTMMVIHL